MPTPLQNINAEKIQGNLSITSVSATTYYNLPTSGGAFTGGTVSGATIFTGGLSANTISATTYFNLPIDITVTGGTYTAGTATFTNNTGGTFNVSGFSTGTSSTDIYVTGSTYSNNNFLFTNNTGGTFNVLFNTVTGLTVNGNLTVTGNTNIKGLTATSATLSGSGSNVLTIIGSGDTSNPIFTIQNLSGNTLFSVADYTSGPLFWVDSFNGSPILEVNDFSPQLVIYGGISGSSLTATTISASTYLNLPIDISVTGGTYSSGTAIFTNNTGGTFSVSGFSTGGSGTSFTGGTVSGETIFTNGLTANTISATTYFNLPTDIRVTGGTYSSGTATFTNNTGGTFSVSGFSTGGGSSSDIYVTGATYSNNTFTYTNNTGGTFSTLFNTMTGLTISGNLTVTGGTQSLFSGNSSVEMVKIIQAGSGDAFVVQDQANGDSSHFVINASGNTAIGLTQPLGNDKLTVSGNTNIYGGLTATTISSTSGIFSGSGQNVLTVIGSGNSTTSPIFSIQGSQGELFSVTDSLTGSLFSVNDISGLPILEVFSDNTTLMGSYQAPSLNTTTKVTLTAGTNNIYSIPTSAYTGAFFDYTVISSGSTGARAGNIMAIWSGTTTQYSETSTNDIGNTAGITFSVAVSGNNAVLSSSATTGGWTLKTIIRTI